MEPKFIQSKIMPKVTILAWYDGFTLRIPCRSDRDLSLMYVQWITVCTDKKKEELCKEAWSQVDKLAIIHKARYNY